jgi:hypothetical protein
MTPTSMGMGGAWWGGGSEEECIKGIHRALDLGITYLDTYPELESWWGRALAGGRRQQIYLQAKVTTHGSEGFISDHSGAATRKSVESSLQRLQTDYIDTLLIHGYDEPEDIDSGEMKDPLDPGNALDELVKMREEGKLRHIGIGARSRPETNISDKPNLLRNEGGNTGNWLIVELTGAVHADAIGARVIVVTARGRQLRERHTGGSYLSCHDPRLHFGLGQATKADIEITWPGGETQVLKAVEVNQILRVHQAD